MELWVSDGGLLVALADLEGGLRIGRVGHHRWACPHGMPLGHDLPLVLGSGIMTPLFQPHSFHLNLIFEGDLELGLCLQYFLWRGSHHTGLVAQDSGTRGRDRT